MKRALDLLIALALVPLVVPICLLAMIAIVVETAGSPLFVQERVGRGQRRFRMLKLRTMLPGTGDLPSHLVDSRRISRVGAFLRHTKLDELPQLANVIAGSMSFVGPRPCLPSQDLLIAEREKRGVFDHLPGITGPAQLAGYDMSDPVLLARVEAAALADRSALADLRLMLRTAFGHGKGDAALKKQLSHGADQA